MQYTRLGRTGLHVSRICLGCMTYGVPDRGAHPWTLDEAASRPLLRQAVEAGHQLLRHRQRLFGRHVAKRSSAARCATSRAATRSSSPPRCAIASRRAPNVGGLSRKAILHEIDASLRRLGMDYVDLYQIHRWDPDTPIEETMEALHDVVKAGKARYIGASSMFAWQFAKALQVAARHGWTRFVSMQPELQPALPRGRARDAAAVPRPGRRRHPVEPAGAAAGWRGPGASTRRASPATTSARRCSRTPRTTTAASSRRWPGGARSAACRGRRWRWPGCCRQPGVTAPIVGASKPAHLDDAVAALKLAAAAPRRWPRWKRRTCRTRWSASSDAGAAPGQAPDPLARSPRGTASATAGAC